MQAMSKLSGVDGSVGVEQRIDEQQHSVGVVREIIAWPSKHVSYERMTVYEAELNRTFSIIFMGSVLCHKFSCSMHRQALLLPVKQIGSCLLNLNLEIKTHHKCNLLFRHPILRRPTGCTF